MSAFRSQTFVPFMAAGFITAILGQSLSFGGEITVNNSPELRRAVQQAAPGAVILLAPGHYDSVWIENASGTKDQAIVITAADESKPPVFTGGSEAIHFSKCRYVTLRHVNVMGCTANGINADDGGDIQSPSVGMIFEHITIENIGPQGNHDGLKLSGLSDFAVRHCTISGWGGSAIDMVGCRDGVIESCRFLGQEGFSQSNGVQVKGGCERITIRRNFFRDAGQRAVNIGGSTGLSYFRPKPQGFEARDIDVACNHFVGSMAPIAFVTAVDCRVRQNTVINPEKWVLRILQEQPMDKFQPCQRGVFEANLIVFDRRVQTFVNVGPDTKPDTFTFSRNAWFCSDADRRPALPTPEQEGVYQVDPQIANADSPEMAVGSKDPRLAGIGAHACKP